MSVDQPPDGPPAELADSLESDGAVDRVSEADRSLPASGRDARELLDDLQSRIAELDAIAWNLPSRRDVIPRDGRWPDGETSLPDRDQ